RCWCTCRRRSACGALRRTSACSWRRWGAGALRRPEADLGRRLRRPHEVVDAVEDDVELAVVALLEVVDAAAELAVADEPAAQVNEGADDLDVDVDGALA